MPRRGPIAWVVLGLVLASVSWVGARSPWRAFAFTPAAWQQSDFQILWAAGQGLSEGLDVTEPAQLDAVGRRAGRELTPFSAALPLVSRLFGALSPDFERAWSLALAGQMLLALVLLVLLSLILIRQGLAAVPSLALALAALGLGNGFWMSLAMNSTNLFALAAVCASVLAAQADRQVAEGVWLGLAVVAKTSPLLVALVALMAGRRRTALVCAVTWLAAAALSVAWLGWAPHQAWLEHTLPALGYAPQLDAGRFNNALHAWNLAPHGLLARSALGAGLPRTAVLAGSFVVVALVLWQLLLAARARRGPTNAPLLAAAALAGSLLVSSVTWPHHLVFAALPAALVVASLRRAPWQAGLGLVATCVLALPLGSLGEQALPRVGIPLRTAACVLLFAAAVALPGDDSSPRAVSGTARAPGERS